jgi:hypothetical protein
MLRSVKRLDLELRSKAIRDMSTGFHFTLLILPLNTIQIANAHVEYELWQLRLQEMETVEAPQTTM